MTSKQISVFIENRKGRLGEILKVLTTSRVNIVSMSLADTSEYGLLRLIVDKPTDGKFALQASGFSCMLTDVFIVKLPHEPGALQATLKKIADEELSVEYMYGLSAIGEEAAIVLKISDEKRAEEVFKQYGIETIAGVVSA